MALSLETFIGNLNTLNFYEIFFPWVLFFAVLYGLLNKTKAISEEVSVNAIISAIIPFFIINYVVPPGFFSTLFGAVGMVLAALLSLILFLAIMDIKPKDLPGGKKAVGGALAIVMIVTFFSLSGNLSDGTIETLLLLVVMFMVVAFIIGGGKKSD